MSDTLQIFGKTYEGVTGLVAKDSGGVDVIYTAGASANLQSNKNVASSSSTFIVAPDSGYDGLEQVTVTGMPEMASPSINYTISSNGKLNITTYTYRGYSPGYAVTRSDQLATASGSTVVPSSSSQIAVASGKYTTGDIIVAAERISPAKVVNPSEVQQIILPDEIIPETPDASVPAGTSGRMSGTQLCLWDFKPAGWGVVGQQYYINAEFTAVDNTKVVIDGCATYASNYCGDGHGGCYLTSITTVTGASASLIQGTEWWRGGNYEQIYIDGYDDSDLTSLGFTTSKELKVYLVPFERESGIAQVTVNGAPLQAKTATPSSSQQIITPDSSRIFTAPVGTQTDGSNIFYIHNLPSSSNYLQGYLKGQITMSDGTILNIDGFCNRSDSYSFNLSDIITISGTKTLIGIYWLLDDFMFQFNEDSTGLTGEVTQELTIDTINPLYSIAAGSSYSMSGGYCAIPVAQGSIDTEYYIYGKLQCPNGANVSIDGEATVGSQGVNLTSITTLDSGIFYNPPYWHNNTFSFELGASPTGNVVLQSPFFIVPTPVTESYYGLSSVTVEPIPGSVVSDAVRFIDYDGSIVYTYSANDFLALAAMPSNPTHEGLTAQGWNWTLAEAQEYVEEWGCVDIGQQYVTTSGDTEIDIEIPTGSKRLEPYLGLGIDGTVQIDWGDGTTSTATGSTVTAQVRTGHTYTNTGKYTISIHKTSGNYRLLGTSTYYLLSGNFNNDRRNRIYASYVKAIRIGSGNSGNMNYLAEYCFYYCINLEYVTIPNLNNVITSIPNSAFSSCYDLKCIILPRSVSSTNTISECYNLKYIVLPGTEVALGSISSSYSLDSLILSKNSYFNNTTLQADNFLFREIIPYLNIKEIKQPYDIQTVLSNMTQIRSYCFSGINNFTEVTIPSNITLISTGSFANCKKLKKVTLSHSITSNTQIFRGCYALEEATLPSDFNGATAFYQCHNLKKINYTPSDLYSSIFYDCYSLKSITLPSNLTTLKAQAFYNCYSLQSIALPSSLTTIDANSLSYCYCLSNLTIPASVTTINRAAFYYNLGMKEYHFLNTTPPTLAATNIFYNIPDDCIIYVPYSADHSVLNAYKTKTNWSTYASNIQEEPQ